VKRRVGKLGDICIIKNGYAFKSKDYVDKGVSIVRTTNFKNETELVKVLFCRQRL
jgi:hypothetical protein